METHLPLLALRMMIKGQMTQHFKMAGHIPAMIFGGLEFDIGVIILTRRVYVCVGGGGRRGAGGMYVYVCESVCVCECECVRVYVCVCVCVCVCV